MNTKDCSCCGMQPTLYQDDFGVIYWLSCDKCGKETHKLASPTSSITNPHIDNGTKSRLIQEWNNIA